jgi:hypothetical protein
MYDVDYRNMVLPKIAVDLPEKVFIDANGKVVENNEGLLYFDFNSNHPNSPLGLPCDSKLIHPEYLLFFDETGCNTNQKKDGYFGGQKFACGKGMTPKQICSTRDRHFSVLGLTASTGDSVLCVVIFASEKQNGVVKNWLEGIDVMVDPVKDINGEIILSEVNFREGKVFSLWSNLLFPRKTNSVLTASIA